MNPVELASIQIGNLADSEQDFDRFYEEYFPKVYNYCYFQIRHRQWAEDLTSAIFEKVLRRYHQFDPGKGSLSTWVFAIARNQITDHYRTGSKKNRLFSRIPFRKNCRTKLRDQKKNSWQTIARSSFIVNLLCCPSGTGKCWS